MDKVNSIITNKEVVATLNTLIETCRDSESGFHEAASGVHDLRLRASLERYSLERVSLIGALQLEVHRYEGESHENGSLAGSLHRGWLNSTTVLTNGDEAAILAECERGEKVAVETYLGELEKELPSSLRHLISRQCNEIERMRDRIRSLQRVYQAPHQPSNRQSGN